MKIESSSKWKNDLRDQIAHNIKKGVLKSTPDGEVKYSWRGWVYLWCQFLLDLVGFNGEARMTNVEGMTKPEKT